MPTCPSSSAVAWTLRGRDDVAWLDDPSGNDIVVWGAVESVETGIGWPERLREALRPAGRRFDVPFASGVVGYIGYEAGRQLETMPDPVSPAPMPELVLRRYEGSLVRRPQGGWMAVGPPEWLDEAEAVVASAQEPPDSRAVAKELPSDATPFLRGVEAALRAIRRGDYYQVNLARRLAFQGVDHPLAVYLRLRRAQARFGAFLAVPGGALLSNSPELFLSLRSGEVQSRPIKGTRPLGARQELEEDPKERAELTMIVDLVRNDLGRVCRPGSVRVEPRRVYELPTLLHAEQAILGTLRPHLDAVDLLQASFPPGSVTGAPKVAAMAAIRELEPCPRGPYTGCIGWFSDTGDAELSVSIRTASVLGDEAWAHVGCGIVADSDPDRELAESDVKAAALRRALTG